MRFDDNGKGAVNYEPNSMGGPVEDPRYREPPLKISGDADRYDHRAGNDDYTQPGNLFRLMSAAQKAALMDNIAAAMTGVPETIVTQALEYLSPETRKKEGQLDEIESYKQQLIELKNKLSVDSDLVEQQKEKYKKLLLKFEVEKQNWIQKSVERAEKKIEKIIDEMKTEKSANFNKLKSELPQIIKYSPSEELIQNEKDFIEKVPPGSTVFVQSLGQDGIIQGTPNAKGEVLVLSKSMRMQIHWKELTPKDANLVLQKSTRARTMLLRSKRHP